MVYENTEIWFRSVVKQQGLERGIRVLFRKQACIYNALRRTSSHTVSKDECSVCRFLPFSVGSLTGIHRFCDLLRISTCR